MHKTYGWMALVGLLAVLGTGTAVAQLRGGLLPVDQAYKLTASIQKPGVITVNWQIAPNYYLYRGRMQFIADAGAALGPPVLPAGKPEFDQFFGKVEIYHDSVTAHVPYTLLPGAKEVKITVGYQGCHEVKPLICYPPQKRTLTLALPAASKGTKS